MAIEMCSLQDNGLRELVKTLKDGKILQANGSLRYNLLGKVEHSKARLLNFRRGNIFQEATRVICNEETGVSSLQAQAYIYGLKQSPDCWNSTLDEYLKEYGEWYIF